MWVEINLAYSQLNIEKAMQDGWMDGKDEERWKETK